MVCKFLCSCIGIILFCSTLEAATSNAWSNTKPMNITRDLHTATLLHNGKVLVAGGWGGGASAELYDPVNKTWVVTGSMNTARSNHTAILLTNGNVLVIGGYNGSVLASAELYNPTTGKWTVTNPMSTARYYHTTTLLPNGKVLVTGGWDGSSYLASAEIYNTVIGTWIATNAMISRRHHHTTTLLPNNQILASGGVGDLDTAIYNSELYASPQIVVKPNRSSITNGSTQQFIAIEKQADGKEKDVTNFVVWKSCNEDIVTISNTGVAVGLKKGVAVITATMESDDKDHDIASSDSMLTVVDIDTYSYNENNYKTRFKSTEQLVNIRPLHSDMAIVPSKLSHSYSVTH